MRRPILLNPEQVQRMQDAIAAASAARAALRVTSHGTSLDNLFAGLDRLSELTEDTHRIYQGIRREILVQRRKDDYARRKKAGLIKPRPTKAQKAATAAAALVEERLVEEYRDRASKSGCHCSTCGHPPCSFCTSSFECSICYQVQHNEEDDGAGVCMTCVDKQPGPLEPPFRPPSGSDYCPITKITCLNTQCLSSKKCVGGGGDLEEKCPSCGTIGWRGLCDCEDEWEDEETDDDNDDDD